MTWNIFIVGCFSSYLHIFSFLLITKSSRSVTVKNVLHMFANTWGWILQALIWPTLDAVEIGNVSAMEIWPDRGKSYVSKRQLLGFRCLTIIDYGIYSVVDIAMALTKLEPGHHTVMMSHGTIS